MALAIETEDSEATDEVGEEADPGEDIYPVRGGGAKEKFTTKKWVTGGTTPRLIYQGWRTALEPSRLMPNS
jgi:hypothetical protein